MQMGNVLLHWWMELVMSFESHSSMVWRLEFVGLYHRLLADEDESGGRFGGTEGCSEVASGGWDGVDGGGGGGDG